MRLDVPLGGEEKGHTKALHACLSRNKMIRCTLVGLWLTLNEKKQGDFQLTLRTQTKQSVSETRSAPKRRTAEHPAHAQRRHYDAVRRRVKQTNMHACVCVCV